MKSLHNSELLTWKFDSGQPRGGHHPAKMLPAAADSEETRRHSSIQGQSLPMASPRSTETPLSPSLLYAILPVAVQTRLPQLRSLRRSWSGYTVSQSQFISDDGRYNRLEAEVCGLRQDESGSPAKIPSTKSLLPAQTPSFKDNEIAWKYANQGAQTLPMPRKTRLTKSTGLSLLETAVAEAEVPEPRSQIFSRQLYIHALAYLIQALPSDLSNAETMCIDDALFHSLQRRTQNSVSPSRAHQQAPSLLHRFLASTIIQFFLLCQFLLPYVRYFLHTAYRYERTHQVSEKILATSVNSGERIGRLWWDILQVISKLPDKKLAAMLASILLWWVQGISGGIHEGIGEGMSIIGVAKADFT